MPHSPPFSEPADPHEGAGVDSSAAVLAERTAQSLRHLAGGPLTRLPQLLEAMVAIGSDLDVHRVLHRIAETAASLTGARYAAVEVLDEDGDGLRDLITHGTPPEGRPAAPFTLRVPIKVRGELFGSVFVAGQPDGGAAGQGAGPGAEAGRFSEVDLHLVRVLATEAGIAMGNARMHAAARQRRRWIDGAASVTTALLAGPETGSTTEHALTVVAEKGRELAEAATGAVLLPQSDGAMEVVAISTVLSESVRAETYGGTIPPESPVLHQIHAGLAVFSDDFAGDPRSISPLSRHYGPTMLLPLHSGGRVLGALALCRACGDTRFTHLERTLGTQFASQAALALVLADRHRDRERLAVYEDRDRIARDLHDLVIQRLFATGMLLESAQRTAVLPEVTEDVGRAVDELDATIQEIRTAIIALQQGPPEVPAGPRTRILREAGAATAVLGTRPSVHFVGPVDARVGAECARALVAAVGRALAEVARAAASAQVVVDATVTLADGREGVRLTVTGEGEGDDDGPAAPVVWEGPLQP
ncbi:two-component system sensor kinase [Streptomyces noursei ATCC 11455]|uniref:sensor histidine kinase n=2 Tax=Streptomyces noursei TaxID=1971 RepID=UPI00081D2A01|nr:two-component system sensor kinase [Streptomyces noursei ATCC 11455]